MMNPASSVERLRIEIVPGEAIGSRGWRKIVDLCTAAFEMDVAAYIEAVATAPGHQGRGYGSAVMQKVANEVAGFELGGLSTGRFSFYERLGWERWIGPLAIRKDQGLLPTPKDRVMVLRLPRTPKLDLEATLTAEWREGELW